jgi:hypothetical protein
MTTRDSDARIDILAQAPLLGYRDVWTGTEYTVDDPNFAEIHRLETIRKAPRLTPEQEVEFAGELQRLLDTGALNYPRLANAMLRRPDTLFLLPEMGFALDGEFSNEFLAHETAEALLLDYGDTRIAADYQQRSQHDDLQQMFWSEVAGHYDTTERDAFVVLLAQLEERGAARLASRALAWAERGDLTDPEERAKLFFFIHQEAMSQKNWEDSNSGAFGVLDWLENRKDDLFEGIINITSSFFGDPTDAIRRSGLTAGEHVAYRMGYRPQDASWRFTSGLLDGISEIAFDPLNLLAGLGAGIKAVRGTAMTAEVAKAAQAGRIRAATKAFFAPTRRMSQTTFDIRGGRMARSFYMLRGKTVEEMLETRRVRKVIGEFHELAKQGDTAGIALRFPALSDLGDDVLNIIGKTDQTTDDVIETIKSVMLNDVDTGNQVLLDAAEIARAEAFQKLGVQTDIGITQFTGKEEQALLKGLNGMSQHSGQQTGIKQAIDTLLQGGQPKGFTAQARAILKAWNSQATRVDGANRWLSVDQIKEIGAKGKGGRIDMLFESAAPKGASFEAETKALKGVFDEKTKGLIHPFPADESGEIFISGRFEIGDIDAANKTVELKFVEDVIPKFKPVKVGSPDIMKFINEGVEPAVIRDAVLADSKYRQLANKAERFYLVADSLQKPRRLTRAAFIAQASRFGKKAASGAARITPGAPRGKIALFNNKKAVQDLDALFKHYGVSADSAKGLIDEFLNLEYGARQDFIFEEVLPLIGRERGIGVLEHRLISLYRSGKLRQFSNLHNDLWETLSGKIKRGPVFAYQFADEVPIPIDSIDAILRRSNQAGRKGIKLRHRTLLGKANGRRQQIAERFRQKLAQDGVELTDEEAWQIGYSTLSNPGEDGRGWLAAKMLPAIGTAWDFQHNFFKLSMLLGRPIPWSLRVGMEEQLRAFVNGLPSLARNPAGALMAMHEANLLVKAGKYQELATNTVSELVKTTTKGAKTVDDIVARLGDMAPAVFGEKLPTTLRAAKKQVHDFFDIAIRDRTKLGSLNDIVDLKKYGRRQARTLEKADKILDDIGLSMDEIDESFGFIQQQHITRGFITDAADMFSPEPSAWVVGLKEDAAVLHGQKLAYHMLKTTEDAFGRMAALRLVDQLRGDAIGVTRTARALTENAKWPLIRPDLVERYGQLADEALAQRYFTEILEDEIKYLMTPFWDNIDDAAKADMLENLVRNKKLEASVGGLEVDVNFHATRGAANRIGEVVADTANNANIPWPDLAAVPFDPRFVLDDPRVSRRLLKFFGDTTSQVMNRRPAFLASFRRHKRHYLGVGMDDYSATKLAQQKAVDEVNAVFFDAEMAPHAIKKLERFVPFMKATYEVSSQWVYKMPVAVGGYWPMGVGEFGAKLDRVMQALRETGMVRFEQDGNGQRQYFLKVGSTEISLGDPVDPGSFGLLSFFQFAVGASPPGTILASAIKGMIPAASDGRRTTAEEGETWFQLADRIGADPVELAKLNRNIFYDGEELGEINYLGILGNLPDASQLVVPAGLPIRIPQSALANSLEELILPMGEASLYDLGFQFIPASLRNLFTSWGLANAPADDFWREGDLGGVDSFVPIQNKSSVMTQASEHMMYMEAHDLQEVDGELMGPIRRMMKLEAELAEMIRTEAPAEEQNALEHRIAMLHESYIERLKEGVVGQLAVKGLLQQLIPASPFRTREEAIEINSYWASRAYADSLKAGVGELEVQPFETPEQLDEFYEMAAAWLSDDTGETAKALFARENPQLLAYLTPKTFYGPEGIPSENDAFDEYIDQIRAGERVAASPFVTAMRYYDQQINIDYINDYIAKYGSDPDEAAANAIDDRLGHREMQDERSDRYMGRDLFDDMNGGEYDRWRTERRDDEDSAVARLIDRRRDVQIALGTLLNMIEEGSETLDVESLLDDRASLRGAISEVTNSIRALEDEREKSKFSNPFETAYDNYFKEYYVPYQAGLTELYDEMNDQWDSERAQLFFEQIREYRNQAANESVVLNGANYPTALEWQWSGKSEEEKEALLQQWLGRPLLWMDLAQSQRFVENFPGLVDFIPSNIEDFEIYSQATKAKIVINEMYEANEIGSGDKTKLLKQIDEELRSRLTTMGRDGEVVFMDLTPYEKLRLAGVLPVILDTPEYSQALAYYKEELALREVSADSNEGRLVVADFMEMLTLRAEQDPTFRAIVIALGENMFDEGFLDEIFPKLFFDARER